jgi:hypothetical protein
MKVDFILDNLNIILGRNLLVLVTSFFSILFFGIKVFSVVYVFCDAPSKNQNRWLWAFAVMVVPYSVGLLVYLSLCWIKQDENIETDKTQKYNKNFSKAVKISILVLILIGLILGIGYKLAVKSIEDQMKSFNYQSDSDVEEILDGRSGPTSRFIANEINCDESIAVSNHKRDTDENLKLIHGTNKVSGEIHGNDGYFEREIWFQEDGQIKIMSESELDSGKIDISLCEYNGDELISWGLDETVRSAEIDTLDAEANKIYVIKVNLKDNPEGLFAIEWSAKNN